MYLWPKLGQASFVLNLIKGPLCNGAGQGAQGYDCCGDTKGACPPDL